MSHDNNNGVTIIHWTDKPLRSTAGFVAIFNGANYSYETDTFFGFCGVSSHVILYQFAVYITSGIVMEFAMLKTSAISLLFALFAFAAYGSDQDIVLGQKNFYDSAGKPGLEIVYVSGTLTGNGIGYKNNSAFVAC